MEQLLTVSSPIDPSTLWTTGLSDLLTTDIRAAWVRDGFGMVGWGEALTFQTTGGDRFEQMSNWWSEVVADSDGESPLAFSSLSFADSSVVPSVAVVPEIVLEHSRTGTTVLWQVNTRASHVAAALSTGWRPLPGDAVERLMELTSQRPAPQSAQQASVPSGTAHRAEPRVLMSEQDFTDAVAAAVAAIDQGEVSKVVLSRDTVISEPNALNVPQIVSQLTARHRHSWTYLVEGLVGSTPELLISKSGGTAKARVLAGTADRRLVTDGVDAEEFIAERLVNNPKQRFEHQAAVESLVQRLTPYTSALEADDQPFILQLPNLFHLATDVTATLEHDTPVLDLAQAVHPTAAVGGTPRERAVALIEKLEVQAHGMDRGRYAGPVGWFNGAGNGEFGVALRGGMVENAHTLRLFAGGGIVAGSDPADELRETSAKFQPMLSVLKP